MEEISTQVLKERLDELRKIKNPELKHTIAMHNIEQMIAERIRKAKTK